MTRIDPTDPLAALLEWLWRHGPKTSRALDAEAGELLDALGRDEWSSAGLLLRSLHGQRAGGLVLRQAKRSAAGVLWAAESVPWDAPAEPLLEAVPAGAEVRAVTTQVGPDGEVRGQSIKAVPASAPGNVIDQIPEGHRVKGVSTLASGDGSTRVQWVKTERTDEAHAAYIEALTAVLRDRVTARTATVPPPDDPGDDNLLRVYPWGDPHFGMLAWGPEAGADWDLRIADRLHREAMDRLTAGGTPARHGVIVNLGDFFHADSSTNRTPSSGNPLDVDGRFYKIAEVGLGALVYAVDRALEVHRTVELWIVRGNHDPHQARWLSIALRAHFRAEPRVTITPAIRKRHYRLFGTVLLGACHGDTEAVAKLPGLMAQEAREHWSSAKHCHFLRGHVHHRVKEGDGVIVETFQTLAGPDAYHADHGYGGSGRSMHAITYHRTRGEVSRRIETVESLEEGRSDAA